MFIYRHKWRGSRTYRKLKNKAYETYEKYNKEGLRIVAVAQKNDIHGVETFGINDEKDMVLIGFVGFLDPPKESAKQAIEALKYMV
ncbi:adenosine deaminase [human gut metagenome]|uniref:Adenosine deaminase n=1 Tax=human gut metagenome TaxID=408170 RepID=K1SFN1_9ZZZZ